MLSEIIEFEGYIYGEGSETIAVFRYWAQHRTNLRLRSSCIRWKTSIIQDLLHLFCHSSTIILPCEQSFLCCVAQFSVYEVVRVACQAYITNQLRHWQATRTTSYTLKAMQERKLCSQGTIIFHTFIFHSLSSFLGFGMTELSGASHVVNDKIVPGSVGVLLPNLECKVGLDF